jgi:hypothetical protein
MVTLKGGAPWIPKLGLIEVIVGARMTVKPFGRVAEPARVVTVTFWGPAVAFELIAKVAEI